MFSHPVIWGACFLYVGVMFALALWIERKSVAGKNFVNHPVVYALSILVYLTAWTFYGSVGKAASTGNLFLTFYLGPTLIMVIWYSFLKKIIRIRNTYRITSIADLISLRYDRSLFIAALVTLIALLGIIPYIALQLKAIITTFEIITRYPSHNSGEIHSEYIGIVASFFIITFTIVLGVRKRVPTERHQGMVAVIVLDAVVKLFGLLAVGVFVTYSIFNGFGDIFQRFSQTSFHKDIVQMQSGSSFYMMWMSYMLLSMSAFMFLPRQFHISVVENFDESHIRSAVWICPLYFLLITIFILPIAMGGLLTGMPISSADAFVLLIPLNEGKMWLSLLVFIAGFSASTCMIMISSMTISTMVTNHLLLPLLEWVKPFSRLKHYILQFRWLTVAGLIMTGYWFKVKAGNYFTLVDFGIIAFVSVLQFAPAIVGGLYWQKGHKYGAILGMSAGFFIWFYTLILPVFVRSGLMSSSLLENGPWQISALRPEHLFGMTGMDSISHATFWTMFFNISLYVFVSLIATHSKEETILANNFLNALAGSEKPERVIGDLIVSQAKKRETIVDLFSQYFPRLKAIEMAHECFESLEIEPFAKLSILELADLNQVVETHLASAIGAATAHHAMQKSDLINPVEEIALKKAYTDIISKLKLTPTELNAKVNYYQEREKLLSQQAAELQEKIQALDNEISERQRIEDELRNSRQQLADILNFHPDPTFAIDLDGKITIWNRAAEEFSGFKTSDMVGKGDYEYAIPFYGERRPILIDLVFQPVDGVEQLYPHLTWSNGMVSGETATLSSKHKNAYLIGTAAPLYDSEGNVCGAIESIRDITHRKKEEEELFHSRQMLQLVLDNVPQRIFWKDRECKFLGCNKPLAVDCGYTAPDQLIGKTDYDTASASTADQFRADDLYVMETGLPKLNYEELQVRTDGTLAWLKTSKIPLRDENDQIIAVLGMYEDITDKRQADEEIRRLNRVYAVLSDMNQMIVRVRNRSELVNEVCRIAVDVGLFQLAVISEIDHLSASLRCLAYNGCREEDRNFFHTQLCDNQTDLSGKIYEQISTGGRIVSNDLINETFTAPWLESAVQIEYRSFVILPIYATGIYWGALHLFSVERAFFDTPEIKLLEEVAGDFSFALESLEIEKQRRIAEKALQKSEDRYRSLVENLHEVVFVLDTQGKLTYVSPAITGLTQYTPEEVIGQHFEQFIHADDQFLVQQSFEQTLAGNLEPLEYRIIGKNGSIHWIRSSSRLQYSENHLTGMTGIFLDITERRRAEAEIKQRLIELEAVYKVSVVLRSVMKIDDLLPVFLTETLGVMGSDSGCICLKNSETNEFDRHVAYGWCSSISNSFLTRADSIASYVLQTGNSFASNDFSKDSRLLLSHAEPFPSDWGGVCVPIRTADVIVGLLLVSVELPRKMTLDEQRLLNTLSEIAGSSIHRISLHERTERQVHHLNAMHSIDRAITGSLELNVTLEILLDQVINLLGADAADVVTLNLDTQTLLCRNSRGFLSPHYAHIEMPLGRGLAGRIILTRKPLFIESRLESDDEYRASDELAAEGFSAYHGWPLIAKGQVKGVLEVFHRTPFRANQEWMNFFSALAAQAAVAIDNSSLLEAIQTSNQELIVAYDATLEGWARALELHDQETEGHSRRVIDLTLRLAKAMGIDEKKLIHVRRGALLHDIGKMGISDDVLKKPGKLTDDEWLIMKWHPDYAFEMLYPITYLRPALDIPYGHHEKWDGSGYPRGLRGEKIPLAARIFAVIDVYDALLSARPYRDPWPVDKVLEYIRSESGKHFDPEVVRFFLTMIQG